MAPQSNHILVLDTTLRDGEQTPGVNLNLSEKVEIARHLEKLGVDIIEAGFPAASPGDFDSVRAIAQKAQCGVAALCRCVRGDIEKGWGALEGAAKPRLHLFMATSDIHMQYKLRMAPEEVLRRAVESVAFAKTLCDDVEFSCEDATRSERAFLQRILTEVIAAGATTINLPDTVGYATPWEYGQLIEEVLATVPGVKNTVLSVHCHNDLGLAVANTLSGIRSGARQIETTINGLGERAGNCSMEEVIMGLDTRAAFYGFTHSIQTPRIYRTSQWVSQVTGVAVPVCKAIVGVNAFSHESGIHQHGVLANPLTYEIMTPQSVGKTASTMVLGKLSGRHAFQDRLQAMGYTLEKDELDSAFEQFKALADRKKDIADEDLDALVSHMITDVPEIYKLDTFQIQSGNKMKAMASITLLHAGNAITEAAIGDGPVDAAYNAIMRIIGGEWPLAAYDIRAVTGGEDALGQVIVRVKHGGEMHMGRGLSTDIIAASILAYVNAINRALSAAQPA